MGLGTNILDFVKQIDRITVDFTKIEVSTFIRRLSLDALIRIVLRTPVDTGRARGNWQVGVDTSPQGFDLNPPGTVGSSEPVRDAQGRFVSKNAGAGAKAPAVRGAEGPAGAGSIARGSKVLDGLRNRDDFTRIYITNNLPYIEVLEGGRRIEGGRAYGSIQAPAGMVAVSLQELVAGFKTT